MIVTRIAGNAKDDPAIVEGTHVEKVVLPSQDLVKRIQRLTTDHGTEIGLRLPSGAPDLRDGDILALPGGETASAILVEVLPSDVLVIRPSSILQMGKVAHSLGNRHLQAQFFGAESDYGAEVMVVQYDHTVEKFLTDEHVAFDRQDRVMPVPFRHAEHTH
ncbi:urease accessory protein UreE [Curtobacterium sp. S6]|uniref:urease accessory protein UreE n=1 Tax=Curtobacterium sp. S6 TaxID=1479623 RepID=UPI0004AB4F3B|nr:urease accessory protein UreE [Curtobacterium sp. S6]